MEPRADGRGAVARIELYEQHVAQALRSLRAAVGPETTADYWEAATAAYAALIERVPDSDFYRTFYNSVTRDLFGTVGVNPAVEFCATHSGISTRTNQGCSTRPTLR